MALFKVLSEPCASFIDGNGQQIGGSLGDDSQVFIRWTGRDPGKPYASVPSLQCMQLTNIFQIQIYNPVRGIVQSVNFLIHFSRCISNDFVSGNLPSDYLTSDCK